MLHALARTLMFYIQWLTLHLLGIRFVWTVHNIVHHEKQQAGWELWMCRLLARVVDVIIVHCNTARSLAATAYRIEPEKIKIVPHGHYADWYPPMPSKNEARHRLGLPLNKTIFLYFGLVREYKGLEKLLDAFALHKTDDVRLILLGQPNPPALGNSLSVQAAKDPRVTTKFEFIPDEQLVCYLSACDLVVLPYRDSLTSSAVILAASYGRPALIPKLGCMGEFPPEAVILYDPNDPGGLQAALKQAQCAPLETMGLASEAYIQQFPWSLVSAKTLDVYQSVFSG